MKHGTTGGYTNHACRCVACSDAMRSYSRSYRQRADVKHRNAIRARDARADWRWPSYLLRDRRKA